MWSTCNKYEIALICTRACDLWHVCINTTYVCSCTLSNWPAEKWRHLLMKFWAVMIALSLSLPPLPPRPRVLLGDKFLFYENLRLFSKFGRSETSMGSASGCPRCAMHEKARLKGRRTAMKRRAAVRNAVEDEICESFGAFVRNKRRRERGKKQKGETRRWALNGPRGTCIPTGGLTA